MKTPRLALFLAPFSLACSSTTTPPDEVGGTGGVVAGTGGASTGGAPGASGGLTGESGGGPSGSGGATGGADPSGGSSSGGAASGGQTASGGADTASGGGASKPDLPALTAGACTLGTGNQQEMGQTTEQYLSADVTRDGVNYRMITNGWGQNWLSHDISWMGTSMVIQDYEGSRQSNGAPAGYPSVFCGQYSDTSLECGLPMPMADVTQLNTAASWSHPDGNGTYNVAYDVWLGDAEATGFGRLESYFMVWLRDPPGEQPAGTLLGDAMGITVENVSGTWNIIAGTVNGLPIVNYVRAEGDDTHSIAFDIMDFIRDARTRNLEFPGDDLLAIAIGFEIWEGPVTNLALDDFCIDIQ